MELRIPGHPAIQLLVSDAGDLYNAARHWSYVVSNRRRYSEKSRPELEERSRDDLNRLLGLKEEDLQRIAELEQPFVEVAIPFQSENVGWEQRTLPWESLLSLATKRWRGEKQLTVSRHLDCGQSLIPAEIEPKKALIITSAPGGLASIYNFEGESRLISSSLGEKIELRRHNDPTLTQLKELIKVYLPGIIHFSGIDAHQGFDLLNWTPSPTQRDGFFLPDESGLPVPVGAIELAETVTGGTTHKPNFVGFNCYYSAARLAAMAVAQGADVAVGFQDVIDDFTAEQFFAKFYQAWSRLGWKEVHTAFALARHQLADQPVERQGGDAVLWSRRSLVTPVSNQVAFAAGLRKLPWLQLLNSVVQTTLSNLPATASSKRQAFSQKSRSPNPSPSLPAAQTPSQLAPSGTLDIIVKQKERLNYALLHNDQPLFEKFTINKSNPDWVPLIEVAVRLATGDPVEPKYSGSRKLELPGQDYRGIIRLSLVAGLLRGRRESVKTTLDVEVKHGQTIAHKETYTVELLSADEWVDDPQDRQWLPSFVLPRDPAIQQILDASVPYLRALADDSHAGFDGYQSSEEIADPSSVVDCQARAIWSALLYQFPLTYINPPPTYTPKSQRLRSPSQILEEHRGTCIDLALLFAACLEFIGLIPVVFLVQGHAFPGYWRTVKGQKDFLSADAPSQPSAPWMFDVGFFPAITQAIQNGQLVPVETTELTHRGSFRQARDLGIKNLLTVWGFDSMADIQIARDKGITPLPVFNYHS